MFLFLGIYEAILKLFDIMYQKIKYEFIKKIYERDIQT